MSRPSSSKLERLLPHLYATRSEFPFGANGPGTRAFLLQRRSSTDNSTVTMKNVWVYGSSFVGDYLQHLEELGGVTMQLLNHRDEASKYCNVLPAPVFSHELEAQSIRNKHSRVDLTYSGAKHTFDDDLIAYHTPGHAEGVSCYLWQCDNAVSVLFTGDTLYGSGTKDKLSVAPLIFHPYGNNKSDMLSTLETISNLKPTYIVPGLSHSDQFVYPFDKDSIEALRRDLEAE